MMISAATRLFVRQRAGYACEYCGISEVDAGGELTLDHFRPISKGGTDHPDNLIYCCFRCNNFKRDYWPAKENEPQLWNPRLEPAAQHFSLGSDGALTPLTQIGAFTIGRLQLNRPQLCEKRVQTAEALELEKNLARYERLIETVTELVAKQYSLLDEEQMLTREFLNSMRSLLNEKEDGAE